MSNCFVMNQIHEIRRMRKHDSRMLPRLVAVLAASAALAVHGRAQIIDDFDSGSGTLEACFANVYNLHADASILGGKREMTVREALSCQSGGKARERVDATAGVAEWYGSGSCEQSFQYGTQIGEVFKGGVPNSSPNMGVGTPLNLFLTPETEIVVDMVQVLNPFLEIKLRTEAGFFDWNFNVAPGLNLIKLSDFPGMPAAAAADVDGISFEDSACIGSGGDPGGNTPGSGNIFNSLAFNEPITDSDNDGVNDDSDLRPEIRGIGEEGSTPSG